MTSLLESRKAKSGSAGSAIGFETEGGGGWKVWDRYLTLEGKRAYHIGNVCNTCSFFFERLEGANSSVTATGVAEELRSGLASLTDAMVEAWGHVLPARDYVVCLFDVHPDLVVPGSETDYFTHEEVELWGVDGFWGMPHHPRTEYYRLGAAPVGERGRLFEFLVPMFPKSWLKADDVARYTSAIAQGARPTAVAISVLDVKQPAVWTGDPAVTEHWCLAHYLLDGHHKTFAAAQSGQPIRLLSFLAVSEGLSDEAQIRTVLQALRRHAV
jgi:hypothetical protein